MLRIHLDGKLCQKFSGVPKIFQLVSLRSTNNPPTFSNLDPPLPYCAIAANIKQLKSCTTQYKIIKLYKCTEVMLCL